MTTNRFIAQDEVVVDTLKLLEADVNAIPPVRRSEVPEGGGGPQALA